MSKERVLTVLKEHTNQVEKIAPSETLTTEGISEKVGIQRNTTSQYLNELVKEERVLKIRSRPAIFYDKTVFSERFFTPKQTVYDTYEELLNETKNQEQGNDVFSTLIGNRSSLQRVIDQIKAASFYPDTGLPIMLHGETGVGKSLLAKKMHEFCVEKKLIGETAPFLELNCAQYYHNQELLSSILFGYKKGAFTGANEEQVGLLEAADGGILFLDECHRLPAESQEKLFTFMDNQTFSRIGESNKTRKAQVRLIFATTEDIQQNFLRTFIRRVPITVQIPSLQQRTKKEISEYIYTFLIHESQKFAKEIVITSWVLNRLLYLNYRDNVGELKNLIKIICANAYSRQKNHPYVLINSESIENSLLSRFLSLKEIDNLENKDIRITPQSQAGDFMHLETADSTIIHAIFKVFEKLFQQYESGGISEDYLVKQLSREASTVVEMLVYEDAEEKPTLKLLRNTVKELVNFLEASFFIKIRGNSIIALTSYLYKRNNFIFNIPKIDEKTIDSIESFMNVHLLMESKLLNSLLELVETKLDVTLMRMEKILLAFYFKGLGLESQQDAIRGVILAHGFSTASSIADVVNRFMKEHIFDAFDMPFNVSVDKVKEFMTHYIKANDCSKGLIVLADMGSLMFLADTLEPLLDGPLLIINNVTTQQALFVGEMMQNNYDLKIIGDKIKEGLSIEYKVTYPRKQKQPLLITVCQTGLGTAQQLQSFLKASIPEETKFEIEAVDYHYLKKYGKKNGLFQQYDVQGIVGTADPEIDGVPYIALEDLISGKGQEIIDDIFVLVKDPAIRKAINDNLVRNLSIERLLSAVTILDVNKVISYIDQGFVSLERHLQLQLSNSKKAILYVHIASLVERLIRNQEVPIYQGDSSKFMEEKATIAKALEGLEVAYNIKISEYELNYLCEIIFD